MNGENIVQEEMADDELEMIEEDIEDDTADLFDPGVPEQPRGDVATDGYETMHTESQLGTGGAQHAEERRTRSGRILYPGWRRDLAALLTIIIIIGSVLWRLRHPT